MQIATGRLHNATFIPNAFREIRRWVAGKKNQLPSRVSGESNKEWLVLVTEEKMSENL